MINRFVWFPFKFGRQDKRFGVAAFPKLGPGCSRLRKAFHFVKPIIIIPGPPTFDIDGKSRSIGQFATLSLGPFEDFNDLLNKWLIGPSLVLDVDTFRIFLGGQPFIQSGLTCFFGRQIFFLPELHRSVIGCARWRRINRQIGRFSPKVRSRLPSVRGGRAQYRRPHRRRLHAR